MDTKFMNLLAGLTILLAAYSVLALARPSHRAPSLVSVGRVDKVFCSDGTAVREVERPARISVGVPMNWYELFGTFLNVRQRNNTDGTTTFSAQWKPGFRNKYPCGLYADMVIESLFRFR